MIMNLLRGRLFGRLMRASLAALPVVMVLCLFVMLVGWRGKSSAQELRTPVVQAKAGPFIAHSTEEEKDIAAYQRKHILHAVIRVPQ